MEAAMEGQSPLEILGLGRNPKPWGEAKILKSGASGIIGFGDFLKAWCPKFCKKNVNSAKIIEIIKNP